MKRVEKARGRKKPRKKTEPLAEGIRKRRKMRNWKSMGDDEIVGYARRIVEEKGGES